MTSHMKINRSRFAALLLAVCAGMLAAYAQPQDKRQASSQKIRFDSIVVRQIVYPPFEMNDTSVYKDIDIKMVYPTYIEGTSAPKLMNIQKAVVADMLGSDYTQYINPKEAVKHFLDDKKREYMESCYECPPEAREMVLRNWISVSNKTVHQDSLLWCYMFEYDMFMGGAHGFNGVYYSNFDLKSGKKLTEADILIDNQEAKNKLNACIKEELLRVTREKTETYTDDDEEEKQCFFDWDKIEANGNFLLTPQGLAYVYNPYDISAYVMGPSDPFILYSKLSTVINQETLSKYFPNVMKDIYSDQRTPGVTYADADAAYINQFGALVFYDVETGTKMRFAEEKEKVAAYGMKIDTKDLYYLTEVGEKLRLKHINLGDPVAKVEDVADVPVKSLFLKTAYSMSPFPIGFKGKNKLMMYISIHDSVPCLDRGLVFDLKRKQWLWPPPDKLKEQQWEYGMMQDYPYRKIEDETKRLKLQKKYGCNLTADKVTMYFTQNGNTVALTDSLDLERLCDKTIEADPEFFLFRVSPNIKSMYFGIISYTTEFEHGPISVARMNGSGQKTLFSSDVGRGYPVWHGDDILLFLTKENVLMEYHMDTHEEKTIDANIAALQSLGVK